MMNTLQIILAIIIGNAIGMLVNGSLISISGSIIPPPKGVDVTTYEGLKSAIHLFEPKHFIFPFLAHALGTLVGALVGVLITLKSKFRVAMCIGILFLIAGVANCFMLPAPTWFMVVDLVLAYVPMAYLGYKLAIAISQK